MKDKILFRVLLVVMIYALLRYFGGSLGMMLLRPIILLVTFLHEFGHGIGAVITGGGVQGLHINPSDGSGYTQSLGGDPAIILMGGYIGSAIFGNILFMIGAKVVRWHRATLVILACMMAFVSLFWYEDWLTTVVLCGFGGLLYFIARYTTWPGEALMFFGVASTLYIIEDFNNGPASDLQKYAQEVGILSANGWMYVWLGIVVLITLWNVNLIFDKKILPHL